MIEVSTLLFSLIIEGFVVLLIVLFALVLFNFRCKSRDRLAVHKLVDQLKQQSRVRMEQTGSFLNEKYRFEGNDLKKAVKSIDKAEKKFIQKIINVYLKRDADSLISMDAWLAELIETYKGLSPVMPDAEILEAIASGDAGEGKNDEKISELREENEKLIEELKITKETMGNMIAEFGNMFGGGSEHGLEQEDVLGKVTETVSEEKVDEQINEEKKEDEKKKSDEKSEQVLDEGTDDLMDSLDLSE